MASGASHASTLGSVAGSQSGPSVVIAKTDNAHSVVNILTAIHLKKDIVNLPFPTPLPSSGVG